jgi:hypothetical protein
MLGQVFERFVEKSPISVMVRAALERVGPAHMKVVLPQVSCSVPSCLCAGYTLM